MYKLLSINKQWKTLYFLKVSNDKTVIVVGRLPASVYEI